MTSCCVSVLPPRRYVLLPKTLRNDRADDADRIDAGMVVEAAVLDREHRLDHLLRDRLQRHVAALLAAGGDERRDERRVERDAFDVVFSADGSSIVLDPRRLRGLRRAAAEDDADESGPCDRRRAG